VLKHDDRRGEIAPLDACQVTLMRIDWHEDLYKAKYRVSQVLSEFDKANENGYTGSGR